MTPYSEWTVTAWQYPFSLSWGRCLNPQQRIHLGRLGFCLLKYAKQNQPEESRGFQDTSLSQVSKVLKASTIYLMIQKTNDSDETDCKGDF